jgi:hypothetical protein
LTPIPLDTTDAQLAEEREGDVVPIPLASPNAQLAKGHKAECTFLSCCYGFSKKKNNKNGGS